MNRYWVESGSKRRGPFTVEQINEAMRLGGLSGDELVEDDTGRKHFVRTVVATGSPLSVLAPPQSPEYIDTGGGSARPNESWARQLGHVVRRFFSVGPVVGALMVRRLDVDKLFSDAGWDQETAGTFKTIDDHYYTQLEAIASLASATQTKANLKSLLSDMTLLVGGLLIAVSFLFPPWEFTFQRPGISQVRKPAGYGFLLTPPDPSDDSPVFGIALDWSRLSAQIGALAVLTAASLLVVRRVSYLRARQPAIVR